MREFPTATLTLYPEGGGFGDAAPGGWTMQDAHAQAIAKTLNSGSAIASAEDLPKPQRKSYEFMGWKVDCGQEGLKDVAFPLILSADTVLRAQWRPVLRNVKIEASGENSAAGAPKIYLDANCTGEGASQVQELAGTTLYLKANPQAGHTLSKWVAQMEISLEDAANEIYSCVVPDKDVTIQAIYDLASYTVTFDANGGKFGAGSDALDRLSIDVVHGDRVTAMAMPTKDGYALAGWKTAQGKPFDPANTAITEDITLTAQWQYTVRFDKNGGEGAMDALMIDEGETDTRLPECAFSLSDNHFTGWNTAPDGSGTRYASGEAFSSERGNTTLYAQWSSGWRVSFTCEPASGGTVVFYKDAARTQPYDTNPIWVKKGTAVYVTAFPNTQDGYSFCDWTGTRIGKGVTFWPDSFFANTCYTIGETDFNARFKKGTSSTVTFDAGEGEFRSSGASTATIDDVANGTEGSTLSIETPERAGYRFEGWYTEELGDGTSLWNKIILENTTFYAKWRSSERCTVTFDANGGVFANANDATQSVYKGYRATRPNIPSKKITLSQPTSAEYSYVFDGWYPVTDGAMADTPFDFATRIHEDLTLRAKWIKVIAFDANCADYEGAMATIRLDESADGYLLPACAYSREGYTFIGWGLEPQGQQGELHKAGKHMNSERGVTWYAYWREGTTSTLTLRAEGGRFGDTAPEGWTMQDANAQVIAKTLDSGSAINRAGALPEPQRENYKFIGWKVDCGQEGLKDATYPLAVSEDTVLYARWRTLIRNVKIEASGEHSASGAPKIYLDASCTGEGETEVQALEGTTLYLKANPLPGYKLGGWTQQTEISLVDADRAVYSYTVTDQNATLQATYVPRRYTVNFDANGGTFAAGTIGANETLTLVTKTDVGYNQTFDAPNDPARPNHTFDEWYTERESGEKFDFATETITQESDDAITLYARWIAGNCILTLDPNGGTFPSGTQVNDEGQAQVAVLYNTMAQESDLPTPAQEGHRFDGWYKKSAGDSVPMQFDFTQPVTGDVALEAKWVQVYTVELKADPVEGGTIYMTTEDSETAPHLTRAELEAGTTVYLHASAAQGYEFKGWSQAPMTAERQSAPGTFAQNDTQFIVGSANVFLTGEFEKKTYAVTLNGGGGTFLDGANRVSETTLRVTHGETIAQSAIDAADLQRQGFSLSGWQTAQGGTFDLANTTITEDIALTAQWQYTVRFDKNGGEGAMDDLVIAEGKTDTKLPACAFTMADHVFAGWNTQSNGDGTNYAQDAEFFSADGDTTLYATWVSDSVSSETPTPEPKETPTPESKETPTPEPKETPTPESKETPTPEPKETPTPEPKETPTPEPKETPTPESKETPTPEPKETPTPEPKETPTPESKETPTPEPKETPTPEPKETPTPEPKETPTPEPKETPTPEPKETPTPSVTTTPTPQLIITRQATDPIGLEGQRASMTVEAKGDGLTYQWYVDRHDGKGFVPCEGADAATYTTAPLKLENHGYQYYCRVSGKGGSLRTNIVTLTVLAAQPKTSDDSHIALWLMLTAMSVGGMLLILRRGRKKA